MESRYQLERVFDVTERVLPGTTVAALIGLAAVVAVTLVLLWRGGPKPIVLACGALAGALLLAILLTDARRELKLRPCRDALYRHRTRVAEGVVRNCRPWPDGGPGCTALEVEGAYFDAAAIGQRCATTDEALHARGLVEGARVRIRSWGTDVLQVEVERRVQRRRR